MKQYYNLSRQTALDLSLQDANNDWKYLEDRYKETKDPVIKDYILSQERIIMNYIERYDNV